MPEKTELQKIDKGIQNLVDETKKHNRAQEQAGEEEKKLQLSTWGSIKAGFDAFNISLENDEENKITWGKVGNQLKESISTWYRQTLEMDNLLGKTFRLGAAIWENINTHIISSLKTAFSGITSGVREVLGPIADVFDSVKNALIGVFGFFKGVIGSVFGKVKPEDKVRNKLLQGIVNYFKGEKKKDAREFAGKRKMPKPLAMLLLGLGVVIGAVVGAIMAPFRLLLRALQMIKPIGIAIEKYFGKVSKFGKIIAKAGKFLGPLAQGLKLGFKVLGWPITILIGIIDAIRAGWKEYKEGGSVFEIIVAGYKGAVVGFLQLPIKILGWVGDWVLKLFGVEVEGGLASQMMKALDWIFEIPSFLVNIGKLLFKSIKDKLTGGDVDTEASTDMFGMEDPAARMSQIKQAEEARLLEAKRIAERKRIAEEERLARIEEERLAKEARERKMLEEAKATNANIIQLNQTQESAQQQPEQIPDEIDGSLVGVELLWDF